MKFLLRSLLTLAVAIVLGICLYYAVQALPGNSPDARPSGPGVSEVRNDDAENPPVDASPNKREIFQGFRLWTLRKVAGKVFMFSVITAVVVISHKLVGRKGWTLRI